MKMKSMRCLLVIVGVLCSCTGWAYNHAVLTNQWQQVMVRAEGPIEGNYPYSTCFKQAATQHQLPLALLLAVARGESDFDATAVSKANAIGVMQIQWPGTAQHLGIHKKIALYDPCVNIEAGTRYLRQLIDQFGGVHKALAAYNYGPGRIRRSGEMIPQGALWYSSYIYDHLQYVLNSGQEDYGDSLRIPLIDFVEPFRAQGFAKSLRQTSPGTEIHWFQKADGLFSVVAQFGSRSQARREVGKLRKLGFSVWL